MPAELLVQVEPPIVRLTLRNPGRANGVTPAVMDQLADALTGLAAAGAPGPELGGILLTGADRHFCAGADLDELRRILAADGADGLVEYVCDGWMPAVQRALLALWRSDLVTVAAVNGAASSGGLDLALACDYVVAVPEAPLAYSYGRLGQLPVGGGIALLRRRLGPGRARHLLLSGARLAARDGHALGLVDEVAPAGELLATAERRLGEMLAVPAFARTAYQRALRAVEPGYAEHLVHVLEANRALLRTPAGRDRMAAALA